MRFPERLDVSLRESRMPSREESVSPTNHVVHRLRVVLGIAERDELLCTFEPELRRDLRLLLGDAVGDLRTQLREARRLGIDPPELGERPTRLTLDEQDLGEELEVALGFKPPPSGWRWTIRSTSSASSSRFQSLTRSRMRGTESALRRQSSGEELARRVTRLGVVDRAARRVREPER